MPAAHLFVDDIEAPVVSSRDRHHIQRVLRVRTGEDVTVSDGRGAFLTCKVGAGLVLEPTGPPTRAPRPEPLITIGFALVKHERPEWIVQKLTECGVDRIVAFTAARSIVRWDDDKAQRQVERWRDIAREAAMQSRRVWLPEVADHTTLASITSIAGDRVARADHDGSPPSLELSTVLIGPEGGWTDDERAAVPASVAVGPHVFRAETAAVAAGVLLCGLRAGLVDRLRK